MIKIKLISCNVNIEPHGLHHYPEDMETLFNECDDCVSQTFCCCKFDNLPKQIRDFEEHNMKLDFVDKETNSVGVQL